MAEQKFKTNAKFEADVKLSALTANKVPVLDANKVITASVTSDTELSYLSGVTSGVQSQINNKADDNIVIKKDGSVAFTASQSMGGFNLTNLAAPSANGHALRYNELGANNGIATLDAGGKVPVSQLPNAVMTYEGVWNASTNSPALADGGGNAGMVYRVTVAGSQDLGSGSISFAVGDYVIYNSSGVWEKADTTDAVASVNGQTGIVVLDTDNISEGATNKYFTDERAQDAIGGALTDSASIDFTYNDGANTITAAVLPAGVDHDALLNFVANEHIDHSSVSISAGTGLSGGGDITASRTLSLANTAVTPGSYGSASAVGTFTVDAQGRLTAAANASISITSSAVSDFNEAAQDAVGGALTDTASIDFTYNDGANTISAAVLPAGVDHDALLNFVANEHIDHSSVSISAGAGLSGGGDITASRSLAVDINGTTAETSVDNADKILIYDSSASALRSMTRSNFLSGIAGAPAGDINETSFSLANNQASAANVTSFAFANATVRSFDAIASVEIDATADLFEVFRLQGVQKGASWDMSVNATGDDSGVVFTITNAGQIQYTSSNYSGFSSGKIKFRAITTSMG